MAIAVLQYSRSSLRWISLNIPLLNYLIVSLIALVVSPCVVWEIVDLFALIRPQSTGHRAGASTL